jgi:serine/threonine protein kinase
VERSAGPFEILEVLGEGSFGTVCVARVHADPLGRRVALKILKGAYTKNRKILNRTRDEARILSKISHPNIVRVEKLMEVRGRPVVVMEHVEGVSLDQLLARFRDGLPASVALEIARLTFIALHVAYAEAVDDDGRALCVIHRDIKPSNVLLSIHGEVKVVDFGIAKGDFEGREAETESVVIGSRPYMAPERLDGVADSPVVDVYSTGMSLFELLTGNTMTLSINPVQHERAMNRQLEHVRVPGMSQTALEDLRGLIRRMCAYTRDYRPGAAECARDLGALIQRIDPDKRVTLDEFSRSTVRPLYESRKRVLPEDAVKNSEDEAFLREVTGTIGRAEDLSGTGRRWKRAPMMFVGGLSVLVFLLAALALVKYGLLLPDQQVVVKVWLPNDTHTEVGGRRLDAPDVVSVLRGATEMVVEHDDGRAYRCRFTATDDIVVRYVGGSLSIDDGANQPCEPM